MGSSIEVISQKDKDMLEDRGVGNRSFLVVGSDPPNTHKHKVHRRQQQLQPGLLRPPHVEKQNKGHPHRREGVQRARPRTPCRL